MSKRDLDELLRTKGKAHGTTHKRMTHPTGFEPGVCYDHTKGTGTAVAVLKPGQSVEDIAWDEILEGLGLAGVARFVKVTHVRAWNSGNRVCHYVRADVAKDNGRARADVEALSRLIHSREVPRAKKRKAADAALVVALADWQVGGRDGGGVKALIGRVWRAIEGVRDRVAALTKAGKRPARIVVACMGDLIESCSGHYPMQAFAVELDRREQCKVTRGLLFEALTAWAPLAREMVVAAVPGNHGEHRKRGKAFTTFGDNDDVAIVEQLAETLAQKRSTRHVAFVIPKNELTVTLDVCGIPVALAHGHQARRGRDKAITWWKDEAHQGRPVGDCRILITGHYHHLRVIQDGWKTWLQCPSLDGGSEWYENMGGAKTLPGTLTFLAGRDCGPAGWSDLQVIS